MSRRMGRMENKRTLVWIYKREQHRTSREGESQTANRREQERKQDAACGEVCFTLQHVIVPVLLVGRQDHRPLVHMP